MVKSILISAMIDFEKYCSKEEFEQMDAFDKRIFMHLCFNYEFKQKYKNWYIHDADYLLTLDCDLCDTYRELFDIIKTTLKIDDADESYLYMVLYLTMGQQYDAFESEVCGDLSLEKEKSKIIEGACEVILNSDIYKMYEKLIGKINLYNRKYLSQESINIITNKFNEIFHKDYDSDKVFSILEKEIKDCLNKLYNLAFEWNNKEPAISDAFLNDISEIEDEEPEYWINLRKVYDNF